MAVTQTEPLLKSTPDVAKLNEFAGHTVTVTKHLGARGTPGQLVLNTQPLKLDQILALQMQLPLQHGAGYYRFEVVDTGGNRSDSWMVKLGADNPGAPEVFSMAGPGMPPVGGTPPLDGDVKQIAPGYYYNEAQGLLSTPWREVVEWRTGQPFPKPPTSTAAGHLQVVPPNATPWNWPPANGGWGGYPATDSSDSRQVRALEAQIAEQNRQREMDNLRAEVRRANEDMMARMEKMITMITSKPSGPSESEQRLANELAEERRRREENEREDKRREEEQRREERHRIEMQAINEKFDRMVRELAGSKTDPMITLLMQMMSGQQAQSADAVKAIQAATSTASGAAERNVQQMVAQLQGSIISPLQLIQLMQSAKGDGAEMSRSLLDAAREAMAMQKNVFEQLLDVAGQGNQPAWVPVVQQALDKIGAVGAALAERQSQQQQAPQMVPQMMAPRPRAMPPQMQQRAPVAMAATGVPGQLRALSAEEVRARAAMNVEHFAPRPVAPGTPAINTFDGSPADGPAPAVPAQGAPAAIEVVEAPPPAPVAKKRGRPKKQQPPAPEPTPVQEEALPPPRDPRGYTMAELREQDPAEVLEALAPMPDDMLFGDLFPYVQSMRQTVVAPAKVAEYVLQAQAMARAAGKNPPAIELLECEQLEVLVDRLFPGEGNPQLDEYRANVVIELQKALGLDEEDEDEEDDA